MLNEQTNISAGETEVVIAKSFDLLTKMVLNNVEKNCREFRTRQAEHVSIISCSFLLHLFTFFFKYFRFKNTFFFKFFCSI